MTKNIEEAINAQINAELWSAYLYLSMGTNFRAKGLDGVANWFEVQFKEEQEHAMILYKYMQSRGARVVLAPIAAVQTEWATPLEAFEDTLMHEKKVTAMIHNINKMAIEANDYATQNRMVWFIDEQVEEEDEAQKLVDAFKMIEGEKVGMFMLDKELGNRK
ncbi:MAG: ferritin [Bacteroidales bacterium]|nr:ferritin [Bacteroidales bacterium]